MSVEIGVGRQRGSAGGSWLQSAPGPCIPSERVCLSLQRLQRCLCLNKLSKNFVPACFRHFSRLRMIHSNFVLNIQSNNSV